MVAELVKNTPVAGRFGGFQDVGFKSSESVIVQHEGQSFEGKTLT